MDFELSSRVQELRERIRAFLDEHMYPREAEILAAVDSEVGPGVAYPEVLVELRDRARREGLWNLFMPGEGDGCRLSNVEYGVLCEEMGRSPALAPMIFNCAPPDSGNVEILAEHGSEEQRQRWLEPLLAGEIRSCFSMTEPDVAGSDPTLLQASAERDGDSWVLNGHKWFSTGANGADVSLVMCVTDPAAPPHKRASILLVPLDTPGLELVRLVPVMGHAAGPGHGEIRYRDCRVPAGSLLGARGGGFAIAQDRLGPGRIHHCMRAIGTSERAIELICRRANERQAFGGPLGEKQFVQDFVALSRIEVEQARLLTMLAAWKMDTVGKRAARQEISMIKVVAANVAMIVLDRAIQVHGALGMTDDVPLSFLWRYSRQLRLVDGADEVHKMSVARRELARWAA
jgi:acyl-CoA dehydrogenase